MHPQPLFIRVSRIALLPITIIAWYMGIPETPRAVEWMYLIFGCVQLVSMILSYVCPDAVPVRFVVWGVCLADLAAMVLFIYLNYNQEMLVQLLAMTFLIPGVWIAGAIIIKLARILGIIS